MVLSRSGSALNTQYAFWLQLPETSVNPGTQFGECPIISILIVTPGPWSYYDHAIAHCPNIHIQVDK